MQETQVCYEILFYFWNIWTDETCQLFVCLSYAKT